jgi:hypothetical protein
MRISFAGLLIFLTAGIITFRAGAQVRVTVNEIAKIHFVDGAGYLGGFYRNEYDLMPGRGQWKMYQTRESYSRPVVKRSDSKSNLLSKDAAIHQFVKNIDQDSVGIFLKSVNRIKRTFNPADLNISIPALIHKIDTAYLKGTSQKKRKIFHSFYNTASKLYRLLDLMQHDSWTDDYPYSVMEIIKKNGDSVKVITTNQLDYMLPWRINNVPTYDVQINRFFLSATNAKNHRMSGNNLSYNLYSNANYLFADDAFERLRWEEISTKNTKYLKQYFDILKIKRIGDDTWFTIHPKKQSSRILISGMLDISNRSQLIALKQYAGDTLIRLLKNIPFMIDSCLSRKNCTIDFSFNKSRSFYGYGGAEQNDLDNYLKKFNKSDLYPFTIRLGKRTEDNWIAIPKGKFVLTAYVDDYAVGIAPSYIKKDGNQIRKPAFMIFNLAGQKIAP